jgi:hypothetical protein
MSEWRHPGRGPVRARLSGGQPVESWWRGEYSLLHSVGCFIASSHPAGRPNGRPRAAFRAGDCARNCIECNPLSSPRYTPAHSVIPLTGGRFDSKIPTVRQSVRASAGFVRVDALQLVVLSPLNIRASRFPPRPAPTINQQVLSLKSEVLRESSIELCVVGDLAGQLLNNAPIWLGPIRCWLDRG